MPSQPASDPVLTDSPRVAAVSLVAGAVAGGVSVLLGGGLAVALLTAVSFAVVARLTLLYPDTLYDRGASGVPVGFGRWSGYLVGFVALVVGFTAATVRDTSVAVAPTVVAAVGVCWAAWLLGVTYGRAESG